MSLLQRTVCALLLAVSTNAASPSSDALRSIFDKTFTAASPRASSTCTAMGLFCLDCSTLGLCVEVRPGEFLEYSVEECGGTDHCSESLKTCSDKKSSCSQPGEDGALKCQDAGIWPDPFDCNVYWECGKKDPPETDYDAEARHVCTIGTAFDPRTNNCSLSEEEAPCAINEYPLPLCNQDHVTAGPSQLDPNMYYVCVEGNIRLFRCPNGEVYDGNMFQCKSDTETTPETSSPSSTTTTATYVCPGTGRYPEPGSCTHYIECKDPNFPRLGSCWLGYYFNRSKQRCKFGLCPYKD